MQTDIINLRIQDLLVCDLVPMTICLALLHNIKRVKKYYI